MINRKTILGAVALVLMAYAVVQIGRATRDAAPSANARVLMDSVTGAQVTIDLADNAGPYPHVNPRTGERTLYPTEVCFANDCNERGGTRVILNDWLNKPGPTRCPHCGAEVRVLNRSKPRTEEGHETEAKSGA